MIDLSEISTLADIPRVQASLRPDETAIWFEDAELSFGHMETASNQVAHGLLAAGVKPDDRVAYLGKNIAQYYEMLFGAAKARAVMTAVNNRLAPPEMAYILNDSGARVLFITSEFFEVIDALRAECPKLETIIAVEGHHGDLPHYDTWRDSQSPADPGLEVLASDDVIQLYTSGTTGFPKGVMLTNANYIAFFNQASHLEWSSYGVGEAVMNAMPLFHVAGVNVGVLAMAQGAKTVILREIDPGAILRLIPEQQIAHAFWVPAVILMLTQVPNVDEVDFSSLKQVFYGASPIAEDLVKRAVELMGCRFTQLYGLTETVGAGTYLPHEAHDPAWGKLRSCGVPWPGALVRTVDGNGKPTRVNEVGEIVIKSDFVMKGYFGRADATAEAVREGWFHTGDAGYFDEDGFLFIYDRVKDMIVSGGENVYPAEVENALFSHPGVADVAVIGIPSEKWGEEVKAIIVKKPGTNPDPEHIIAFAKERIAAYKCPKSVDFIEALPRNPSGKILRKDLREPYWKDTERRVG